jgi:peptidyl-tRNA hydrolase, PTH1 family
LEICPLVSCLPKGTILERSLFLEKNFLIVGLGNPGLRYKDTRHNVGFEALDFLSERLGIPISKSKFKGLLGEGTWEGIRVVLLKPQTFMNLSGQSVLEAVNWYKVNMDHLIVLYDDVDIEFGKIRIRPKGSSGTHNGMKSVIFHLHSDAFPRIRIGIGRPKEQWNLADFVLSKFDEEEQKIAHQAIVKSCDGIKEILSNGLDKAMNLLNV